MTRYWLLEEAWDWEEYSKIREQLCQGLEEEKHWECGGMIMMGF